MKLSLDLRATLTQTLTPQQIQYLKLLQLPLVQLEQQVIQEIEANPMLEEVSDIDISDEYTEAPAHAEEFDAYEMPGTKEDYHDYDDHSVAGTDHEREYDPYDGYGVGTREHEKALISDEADPFEYYKALWQDDSDYSSKKNNYSEEDDYEPFQIKDVTTFSEELFTQLRLVPLTDEEYLLGAQIIGNIDDDGYLRRELQEILDETNSYIADHNFQVQKAEYEASQVKPADVKQNPALKYALSNDSTKFLIRVHEENPDLSRLPGILLFESLKKDDSNGRAKIYIQVNMAQAEKALKTIQSLDPPGIGSRTVQECLVAQCRSFIDETPAQKLALEILENAYEPFSKKHYPVLLKQFGIDEYTLKDAIEVIRRLNPKPGSGDFRTENNSVIPDFIIEKEEDTEELLITVNDANMPQLKLSSAYERLKREAKQKKYNKETKEWIRNKFEDAKFLIQAIRQRKSTMLKVMTAITEFQKSFFTEGRSGIKPLIYKDVAETTALDISTVCRIVNGKYVQTEFGTYELKFFFSESLPNDDGEDVSTTVIKEIIKDMIEGEPKDRPHSDEKISKDLKDKGYNVARRTVAKYREQLKIPVARLRKEL